jgi:hypothetical protein
MAEGVSQRDRNLWLARAVVLKIMKKGPCVIDLRALTGKRLAALSPCSPYSRERIQSGDFPGMVIALHHADVALQWSFWRMRSVDADERTAVLAALGRAGRAVEVLHHYALDLLRASADLTPCAFLDPPLREEEIEAGSPDAARLTEDLDEVWQRIIDEGQAHGDDDEFDVTHSAADPFGEADWPDEE